MPRGKKRQKRRLTKRVVDSLTATNPSGERYYDQNLAGFGIAVYPSGKKNWFIEYGGKGRRRRMVLGALGELTPDKARTAAENARADVRAGKDPLEERERERKAATFREWIERYLKIAEKDGRHGPRWFIEARRHLDRAAERFGRKRLEEITARDVELFRDAVAETGIPNANRSLSAVKACLNEAWRRDLLPSNEAAKVRKLGGEEPRQRVLTDAELGKLMKSVERHSDPHFRAAMIVLVETGCRRSEILRAQWGDMDLTDLDAATWRIPKPKNRRPVVKPLPHHVAEVLAALPRINMFVVGRWGELTPQRFHKEWSALRRAAKLGTDVRLHDVRRTFGLHATRAAGLHVASKLLGHSSVSITEKIYSPLEDRDLRAGQAAVAKERAKVLPFKRKAKGKENQ